jgi:hypothetical protein
MSVMAKVKTPCEQPVMRTSVGTKFERNAEAMTKTKFVMRVKTSRHATVISVPTCAGGNKKASGSRANTTGLQPGRAGQGRR